MVKTVLSTSHSGLREWKIQRITAIYMAIFSVWFIGYLVCHPGISFAEWHSFYSHQLVKVGTILFIASILYHAWIGMWTIFTDYVKSFVIRCALEFLMLLMLLACLAWGFLILWSL